MKNNSLIKKLKSGFTLIEVLIATSVIVIIGSIIAGIFFSVLRGSSATGVNTAVAQGGNYALSIISNIILNSRSVVDIDNNNNAISNKLCPLTLPVRLKQISFLGYDNGITTLVCQDSQTANNTIASNSAALSNPAVAVASVNLIDNSRINITQNSCFFSCSQSDLFSAPRIDIEFNLESNSFNLPENNVKSTAFRTSVTLRNYQQR